MAPQHIASSFARSLVRSFARSLVRSFARSRSSRLASIGLLALVGLLALLTSPSAQPVSPPFAPHVVYVNSNPHGGNESGDSWMNAISTFYSGILTAQAGDEIWVHEGVYHAQNYNTGFVIDKSIKIYGAFVGTETSVEGRLGLAANTILDGDFTPPSPDAKHVVQVTGVVGNPGVLLDSFVIRNGYADATSAPRGGGLYALNSDVDVRDCTFRSNFATTDGGGLYFEGGPTFNTLNLINCVFDTNGANDNGGGLGGSLLSGQVVNTLFSENWTQNSHGAGMYLKTMGDTNVLTVTNCSFWNNQAGFNGGLGLGQGGAIYLGESAPTTAGGAHAQFVNCTMADNRASACLAGQAILISTHSQSAIYSSILAFNGGTCAAQDPIGGASVVEYTDFWVPNGSFVGQHPNGHNIEFDPLFQSHATGRLTLVANSKCIDAADYDRLPPDSFDLDGDGIGSLEPISLDLLFQKRLVDRAETDTGHASDGIHTYLDMGAYEAPLN
jgi:predicted outer membrane repeat protein